MTAYCGLSCSKCDAYLATKESSDKKREETAQKWSEMYQDDIKADQINCDGCKSNGARFFNCNICKIRECCLAKSVENCAACENYICETLSEFIKVAPEAGLALTTLRSRKNNLIYAIQGGSIGSAFWLFYGMMLFKIDYPPLILYAIFVIFNIPAVLVGILSGDRHPNVPLMVLSVIIQWYLIFYIIARYKTKNTRNNT
jgi:hypothetical protein